MNVGDLVKRRWITLAQKRRAINHGRVVDEVGIVIEIDFLNPAWVMVWFAAARKRQRFKECKKENLEVMNESR